MKETQLSLLPTEKSTPSLTADSAKVLLYGPPKIGKTTLAANIDREHTLFLATEPGHGALSVFKTDVSTWDEFRQVGSELSKGDHDFKLVVVDTVDNLAKACQDHVSSKLNVAHPSDLEYGKGWDAFATEWKLRVSKLASLGLGVWFVSHAKTEEVKQRVGTITVHSPTVSGAPRRFLTGFCDYIFYAESEQTAEGEKRLIRTRATENYEAGARGDLGVELPDPLPLDAPTLKDALEAHAKNLAGATA